MDQRIRSLEAQLGEIVDMADMIHDGLDDTRNGYEELRRNLADFSLSLDNLYCLASLDSGKTMGGWEDEIHISHQIVSCLSAKAQLFDEKLVRVHLDIEDAVLTCNPDLTRSIWDNLLDNALKYTKEMGHVTISVHSNDHFVLVTFQDDGIGIPYDAVPNMFDRYWRGESAQDVPGLGLGLAVVKEATLALKGEVDFQSEPGKGTTVRIQLPIR